MRRHTDDDYIEKDYVRLVENRGLYGHHHEQHGGNLIAAGFFSALIIAAGGAFANRPSAESVYSAPQGAAEKEKARAAPPAVDPPAAAPPAVDPPAVKASSPAAEAPKAEVKMPPATLSAERTSAAVGFGADIEASRAFLQSACDARAAQQSLSALLPGMSEKSYCGPNCVRGSFGVSASEIQCTAAYRIPGQETLTEITVRSRVGPVPVPAS